MKKLLGLILGCLCLAASPVFGASITDKSIGRIIVVLEAGLITEMIVGGGGTGNIPVWTTVTGTGAPVLATSPTLVTPALGTPSAGVLTSCTGLPIATGVSGLGANVATFLATPSSANLAAAVTDESGTGVLCLVNTPTLITPVIGAATGTSLDVGASTLATRSLTVDTGGVFNIDLGGAASDGQIIVATGTGAFA